MNLTPSTHRDDEIAATILAEGRRGYPLSNDQPGASSLHDRVQELVGTLRARSRMALMSAYLCLVMVLVAVVVGAVIFLRANELVDQALPVPTITIDVRGDANFIEQTSDVAMEELVDLKWRIQVLNQVSAIVARIGVVCLLIFLMQFIMRLFRYYQAVHLFFHARAEALSVSRPESLSLQDALQLLSAEHVVFGGFPASPLEAVARGVDRAAAAIPERKSGKGAD